MLISSTGVLVILVWVLLSVSASTAEGAEPSPTPPSAAQGVNDLQSAVQRAPIGLRGSSVVGRAGALDGWLDPAVFTELSPVSVGETPINLPADQRESNDT